MAQTVSIEEARSSGLRFTLTTTVTCFQKIAGAEPGFAMRCFRQPLGNTRAEKPIIRPQFTNMVLERFVGASVGDAWTCGGAFGRARSM